MEETKAATPTQEIQVHDVNHVPDMNGHEPVNGKKRSGSGGTAASFMSDWRKLPLLILSVALMALGRAGPILTRVYFLHGGARLWLSSLIQIAGWPLVLVPLAASYFMRRRDSIHSPGHSQPRLLLSTWPVVAACLVLGLISGVDCYLFAYGSSYLPVSTGALLISTQLGFTALFSFLIVRQRFTAFSVNAITLLILAAVVIGLHVSGDRPAGESNAKYYLGFAMTIAAAALYGLLLPLVELAYKKVVAGEVTYTLVMEMNMLMGIFGTGFCLVGMVANNDFQAMPREAEAFGLGKTKYWLVLGFATLGWELFNLGFVGLIWCSSSLFAGVVLAVLLPVRQVLAVILLHEKFTSAKGVSLVLALWGFVSYLYGEWKLSKKARKTSQAETPSMP